MSEEFNINAYFKRLKAFCVPLLGASRLTPASHAETSARLSQIIQILGEIPPEKLTTNLISYVFLPLTTLLQRNASADIPNQILEKILIALKLLVDSWWWTCDIKIWEQIFMLCGAVVGELDMKSDTNKSQKRDDETKDAATRCICSLIRPRDGEEAAKRGILPNVPDERLALFQAHTQNPKFTPVVGQTLDSLIVTAMSSNISLQIASLETTALIIDLYLPDALLPSVLPGTVSAMTKICLGIPQGKKGWANGDIVLQGLQVMRVIITKAIGNDVCIRDGAICRVHDLTDLLNTPSTTFESTNETTYFTQRSESWLRGTSTQLHIAINTLSPLISHPTPTALLGLARFSSSIIQSTSLTLPQTRPLLLSFLLALSISEYTSVSSEARGQLMTLLSMPSDAQTPLQHAILTTLGDNLSALPRLLSTQIDSRVRHAAGLITAVCSLAFDPVSDASLPVIAKGIGQLLGPTGGVEKWGWSLLSVLEIIEPPITVTNTSGAQLTLENDPSALQWVNFPDVVFKNISAHETRNALNDTFHALGAAGGDAGLFAVEWFISVGLSGTSITSVAALWCACRLLEGIGYVSLYSGQVSALPNSLASKRLDKQVRSLAKSIAEIWDTSYDIAGDTSLPNTEEESSFLVQHQIGLNPLHETLKIIKPPGPKKVNVKHQPIVHRALALQLLAVAAGISQARFTPLFIHVLYPILHSLVSPVSFLSSTALAALNYITIATSYASPANLLLSNFDYVLDSVSRRLTPRWLDIDATKVLGIMIRFVGADVVEKAGDVVEECFDRLDEYHGYGVIVDGLVEVLMEVIKVIEVEARANKTLLNNTSADVSNENRGPQRVSLDDLLEFLPKRYEVPPEDDTYYGPAPKEAWGGKDDDGQEDGAEYQEGSGLSNFQSSSDEPPPTPVQALTKQIITRSLYFLTHESPVIRGKIMVLLTLSVPVLPESALLPSIHSAWPFILNRLADSETFVVSSAAGLVEALSKEMGEFMFRRVWDDVWPKFKLMLSNLEKGESTSALARNDRAGVGTESAYTHSHRLYRSFIKTMTLALQGVHEHETSFWEVIMAFRRFLSTTAQEELQQCAVALYVQAGKSNPDSVWLALSSTICPAEPVVEFMKGVWDIKHNADVVFKSLN
ncbi:TELO2-interacting protein 1-like protein [Psilocybe cubensis]|uniref:TEL2-interacting protein 1 n=2 Tax=Psilocybe cubensis TaxID=181762 RepID=A0A8H7Y522_PSICU|nr:TELO2-interacting protein 1-like protein [Psilocybe cubensis]KAH9486499.1 TELO2-interacting protein 1-like protein [Psilocybe cubensis]